MAVILIADPFGVMTEDWIDMAALVDSAIGGKGCFMHPSLFFGDYYV